MKRKTTLIIALALSLAVALVMIASDEDLREKLGSAYWVLGLAIIGCVLLVLAGYVWDRTLLDDIRKINSTAKSVDAPLSNLSEDTDEVISLARRIEHMARSLQTIEASYRGIVEDQVDLICRYRDDGLLTFVNGSYARFFGSRRQDLIGHRFMALVGNSPLKIGARGLPKELDFELETTAPDGRIVIHQWIHRTIRDSEGRTMEYQAVGHDITDRKEAELALKAAKETAEAADRVKSEFLTIVSHEIRTPINGVIGFAKLLSESPLSSDQRSYVESIETSGVALERLTSDILDLSKMEAGKFSIDYAPFAPRDCIRSVCDFFQPQLTQGGLKFDCVIEDDLPGIINGDQGRLRQVLINLIGNAVKFTEQGRIDLHVNGVRGPLKPDSNIRELRMFFTLRDTGIGIKPEQLPQLFRPFGQVDSSLSRRHGGTGLGLIISKRICELMQGDISVESKAGEGSVFRFNMLVDYQVGDSHAPFETVAKASA